MKRSGKVLALVALFATTATIKPALAQCPNCPTGVWCVSGAGTEWYACVQYTNFCVLIGGGCNPQLSSVAPDGSLLAARGSTLKLRSFETNDVLAAHFSTAGCRDYVVNRSYTVAAGVEKRSRTFTLAV
jgi:hypothetical protein